MFDNSKKKIPDLWKGNALFRTTGVHSQKETFTSQRLRDAGQFVWLLVWI